MCYEDVSDYKIEFFEKIKSLLVTEKYENFKELIQYPFPTTSIIDAIKDQYSKVFEAKDSFLQIDIKDEAKKKSFKDLLTRLNENSFWQNEAFDCLFGAVNSVIVIDYPVNGGDPFFRLIDSTDIHDVSVKNSKIDYVIIKQFEESVIDGKEVELKYYIFIDSARYIKFEQVSTKEGLSFVLNSEVSHKLGETPANFLYQEGLYSTQNIVKRSAITSVLGLSDEYLIKYTSKQFLDLYNAYPIYWKYTEDTDDETDESVLRNDIMSMNGGEEILANGGFERILSNLKTRKKQKLLGVGTVMEVDAPMDNTEPDLREPVGIISPDTNSLEYNVKEIERLESKIYMKATGRPEQQQIADRPVNSQIQSQYEGERNVLLWLAGQLSESRTWLLNSLAKLYTGENAECTAYFGTEYFIEDERSVIQNLRDYKDAGASQSQIWLRSRSLMQVSTKGKPMERDRLEMLEQLEPLYNLSMADASDLVLKDLIEFKDFDLKLNFSERISKFEREQKPILIYENKLAFSERINKIKQILYTYGTTKKFNNGQGSISGAGIGQPKTNVGQS